LRGIEGIVVLAIAMNMVAVVGVVFGLYALVILLLWVFAVAIRVRGR
jgi:hypothetical protein